MMLLRRHYAFKARSARTLAFCKQAVNVCDACCELSGHENSPLCFNKHHRELPLALLANALLQSKRVEHAQLCAPERAKQTLKNEALVRQLLSDIALLEQMLVLSQLLQCAIGKTLQHPGSQSFNVILGLSAHFLSHYHGHLENNIKSVPDRGIRLFEVKLSQNMGQPC